MSGVPALRRTLDRLLLFSFSACLLAVFGCSEQPPPMIRAVVPLGLGAKQCPVGWVADHLGGSVYVAFFCFVIFALKPGANRLRVVAGVTLATCVVEFLQLWNAPWLEAASRQVKERLY